MLRGTVLLLICLSFGFIVETPETRRQDEMRSKEWAKAVGEQYNLKQLRAFLISATKHQKVCDGIDLTKAKIGTQWKPAGAVLMCGDWLLTMSIPSDDHFRLIWEYDRTPEKNGSFTQKGIALECLKTGRNQFRVVQAHKYEDEMVILLP